MLDFTGVYKSFGNTEVLKGVDVNVGEGEIVGIIGSSGSGKSTFLRCINFLEKADQGKINLDGRSFDVRNASKNDIQYMRMNTAKDIGSLMAPKKLIHYFPHQNHLLPLLWALLFRKHFCVKKTESSISFPGN